MKVLTSSQMFSAEQAQVNRGMSFTRLMENAGSACARAVRERFASLEQSRGLICVLCGKGKNGGDGFVIAKNLSDKGYGIRLVLTNGYPTAYESKIMYAYLEDKPVLVSDLKQNYDACVSACMTERPTRWRRSARSSA